MLLLTVFDSGGDHVPRRKGPAAAAMLSSNRAHKEQIAAHAHSANNGRTLNNKLKRTASSSAEDADMLTSCSDLVASTNEVRFGAEHRITITLRLHCVSYQPKQHYIHCILLLFVSCSLCQAKRQRGSKDSASASGTCSYSELIVGEVRVRLVDWNIGELSVMLHSKTLFMTSALLYVWDVDSVLNLDTQASVQAA